MKASFPKRLFAYTIDLMVMLLLVMVIYTFLPETNNVHALNQEMNEITELALNQEIGLSTYFERYSLIIHDLDQERVIYQILNGILLIGYFIVLPSFYDGKTIGKQLVGIKVRKNDGSSVTMHELITRSIFIHGLGYLMISLASLYLLPANLYFIVTTIFGILQILLVIFSVLMILYRKDKRGLHDLVAETSVVISKEG